MKLSAKAEYACLALLCLARQHATGDIMPIRKVAEVHRIPVSFLVQILLDLKRAGLVESSRGASGGYRLARDPVDVSLLEIIEAIDGPVTECLVTEHAHPARQALHNAVQQVAQQQADALASVTLADLATEAATADSAMWYI